MFDTMKRHEIQVLRRAGHTQAEVARLTGTSERTVPRVEEEPAVTSFDPGETGRRGIGRPSKAEAFRPFVKSVLASEPEVMSLEILRRARLDGYTSDVTSSAMPRLKPASAPLIASTNAP